MKFGSNGRILILTLVMFAFIFSPASATLCGDTKALQSQVYWRWASPIAITDYACVDGKIKMVLLNTGPTDIEGRTILLNNTITVQTILLNNTETGVGYKDQIGVVLDPGSRKEFKTSTECQISKNDSSYNVEFTYLLNSKEKLQKGAKNLILKGEWAGPSIFPKGKCGANIDWAYFLFIIWAVVFVGSIIWFWFLKKRDEKIEMTMFIVWGVLIGLLILFVYLFGGFI